LRGGARTLTRKAGEEAAPHDGVDDDDDDRMMEQTRVYIYII
jgi:hypothetical protein